MSQTRKRLMV